MVSHRSRVSVFLPTKWPSSPLDVEHYLPVPRGVSRVSEIRSADSLVDYSGHFPRLQSRGVVLGGVRDGGHHAGGEGGASALHC
jgi:hypothetical protein